MGLVRALTRSDQSPLPRGQRPAAPAISPDVVTANQQAVEAYYAFGPPAQGSPLAYPTPGIDPYMLDGNALVEGIPAAWRASNMIATIVGQAPLRTFQHEIDEGSVDIDLRVPSPQIIRRPWPQYTYFEYMFAMTISLLFHGNFYGLKTDWDLSTGYPRQIVPIHPDDVIQHVENGYPQYEIVPLERTYGRSDIFHVRGFCTPGALFGLGVIEVHRQGLTDAKVLANYGADAYTGGGVPPVVLTVDKPELSEGEAEYMQSRWLQRHAAGNRIPAVVPKIVTVDKIGLSMADAEYLESRKFSIAEIAFMFNLAPEDLSTSLGGSGSMNYQNVESRARERLLYSINQWLYRIEQAFADLLPGSQYTRFWTFELLRADMQDQIQTFANALDAGIYTLNEIRLFLRMPKYKEPWADQPFGKPPSANPVPAQLQPFTGGGAKNDGNAADSGAQRPAGGHRADGTNGTNGNRSNDAVGRR